MVNKELIKNDIDFNKMKEIVSVIHGIKLKRDYLINSENQPFIQLQPLDVKLIEKIKELEDRIAELEIKAATQQK